jgi:ComF family protein
MKNNAIYSTNKNDAIKSKDSSWLQIISNLVFPLCCQICGVPLDFTQNGTICNDCFSRFTFLKKPYCPVCGLMFLKTGGDSHRCVACRNNPPYFFKARSLVRYSEDVGVLVHKFKFGGDLSLLSTFGKWAENRNWPVSGSKADYIIPVPLHPARIRDRGFNQAALLAGVFFPTEKYKIKHFLKRIKQTTPQSKLGGESRRKNLKNCFKLFDTSIVKDKIIYLVDDVFTTGTTVNECSRVLVEAGAKRVEVFTVAMVVKENEL